MLTQFRIVVTRQAQEAVYTLSLVSGLEYVTRDKNTIEAWTNETHRIGAITSQIAALPGFRRMTRRTF